MLRLKLYQPPLTHGPPLLHYYAENQTLVDLKKFIIKYIDKHREIVNTGENPLRGPKTLQCDVKYKGFLKKEWHDADAVAGGSPQRDRRSLCRGKK